ncbi:ABC transporter permease [Paenibacillus baekrokdamisoli]|uniref:ABC transporter permease n=1 Tax=Paenibacillus baekrokdamisoli TaxID=1712516 RepID=A0A3G9IWG8_9BACL|nr:ABC transporter permease [Paenibacillus baekrokdamisoli]MBB3068326.1 putative ABC transport system permease protein [Paenibacillus baekrokdamisoli]BBH22632.1 ABC transporter permease [Paenibacillus baekrokdamisoli]
MTLFSIARKNIRNNFTNYFLYFASMIFSIIIYFTFVSLKYDHTIQSASDASPKISSVFSGAAIVLMIFVAIFIWYSNSFFTRKRKKEVGLYSLLGLRKKQIGRMLFYENFIMGILALIIGIALGSLLSKFFVSLLMKVMGYDAIVNFSVSSEAIINTIIIFSIITLITSFQGYRLIYRFKLIELFHADQESEQEPKTSFIIALLSVVLIGIGYWLALQNFMESMIWKSLGFMLTPLIILITVILGTYVLFSALTVTLLKISRKNKNSYWKGINLIGTSQLLYRIKGNARTLTIIAVLSATTLTAVGTAYSLYYNNRSTVEKVNPNSMMFMATGSSLTKQAEDIISHNQNHKVIYHNTITVIQMDADATNLNNAYASTEQTYTLISNRDFNQLVKLQGRDDVLSLNANEAAALDPVYMEGMSPKYVGATILLKANSGGENITFKDLKKYSVLNLHTVYSTVVISDELFARLEKETSPVSLEAYGITHEDKAKQLTKELQAVLPNKAAFSSFYMDFTAGLESSGLMIFMGGFLGLVFLAATGSIIYFKQLTEANSDKGRYQILYKIGVNKKEVRKSIAKQVLFIFALPLLAGIVHCAVALTALSKLLQTNLVIPVVICMGVYLCMYIFYYFLTVNAYYKIVTK